MAGVGGILGAVRWSKTASDVDKPGGLVAAVVVRTITHEDGTVDVVSDVQSPAVVLVKVRPTGTLEWGELAVFSPTWVPDLVKALQRAERITREIRTFESDD